MRYIKKFICICISILLVFDYSPVLHSYETSGLQTLSSWLQEGKLSPWMTQLQTSMLSNSAAPFVLVIQDLHADEKTQLNIAGMIRRFMDETGQPLTLFAEGAYGEVNPGLFGSFPDTAIREDATRDFLKEGWVTGPEYLLISKYDSFPLKIRGIENPDLYAKDFDAFRLVHRQDKGMRRGFLSARKLIRNLKEKLYNAELIGFVRQIEQRLSGETELNDYIERLSNRKNFQAFPRLAEYLDIIRKKKNIDLKKLEAERNQLAKDLTIALNRDRLMYLVQKSMEFRLNRLSELEYYSFLSAEAENNQINLSTQFPVLSNFLIVLKLQSRVDIWKLSEELQTFENDIVKSLLRSPEEERLEALSKNFQVLEDLSELTLMRRDWEFYENHLSSFNSGNLIKELKVLSDKAQIRFSPRLKKWLKSVFFKKHMSLAESFYHFARERDAAMTKEAVDFMRAGGLKQAVLVAGGFHTEGVRRILEAQGISYGVVIPKLGEVSDNGIYLTRMLDHRFEKQNLAFPSLFSNLMERLSPLLREEQWQSLARIYIRGWLQRENLPLSDAVLKARFKGLYYFWKQGIERKSPEDLGRLDRILTIMEEELDAVNRIQLPNQAQIKKFIKRSSVHAEITLEFLRRFYPARKDMFAFAQDLYENLYVKKKSEKESPASRLEKLKQVDMANLQSGTNLSYLLKTVLDYDPDQKDGPSLSLDEITEKMNRKERVINTDMPVIDCFLGRIDLNRLNDVSRYRGEDARMQLAIDLEIAHLLGLVRIKTFASNGCVGLNSKPAKTIEGTDMQLSWSNLFWLRKEAHKLEEIGLEGNYRGKPVHEIVDTDDGQIWFYEQVLGLENIKSSHTGAIYVALPNELKNKGILSRWNKLQLNFQEAVLLRDEARKLKEAGLEGEYHGRRVEEIVSSDDGQIWFYEEVFGKDRVKKMYLGAAYSVLPSEMKVRRNLLYSWTKLQLNYEDAVDLRSLSYQLQEAGMEGEWRGRKVKDIISSDDGQLWFYEQVFGRHRVEQLHLGSVFTALPSELRSPDGLLENWNMLKLNFKDVLKLRTELSRLSRLKPEDEYEGRELSEIINNDEGQIWFYEKVFGKNRLESVHLETLFSVISPELKRDFLKNWHMIQLNYKDVVLLLQEINQLKILGIKGKYQVRGEERLVRDIVASEEGQIWFYERVFGDRIKDLHLGRLYTSIPFALKGTGNLLQNWRILDLDYEDVIQLRSEVRKLEALGKQGVYKGRKVAEIISSNEGQMWFYRQVFGTRFDRMGYESIYSALPSKSKQELLKNWTQPRERDERVALEFLEEYAQMHGWEKAIAVYGAGPGFLRLMFDIALEKGVSISPYALSAHVRDGAKLADLLKVPENIRDKFTDHELWHPDVILLPIKKIKSVQLFLKRKLREKGSEQFWKAYSGKGGIHKIRSELGNEQKLEMPPVGLLNALLSKWEFVEELLDIRDSEIKRSLDLLQAQSPWSPAMRSGKGEGLIGNFVTSLNQSVSGEEGARTKLDFLKDSSSSETGAYEFILVAAYDVFRNRLKEGGEIEKAVTSVAEIVDRNLETTAEPETNLQRNMDNLLIQVLLGIHFGQDREFLNFSRRIFQSTASDSMQTLFDKFEKDQTLELGELVYVYFIYSETKDREPYEQAKKILETLSQRYKERSIYQNMILETFLQYLEEIDFSNLNASSSAVTETETHVDAAAPESQEGSTQTRSEMEEGEEPEASALSSAYPVRPAGIITLEEAQHLAIARALTAARGNITHASKLIELSRETVHRILVKYGEKASDFENPAVLADSSQIIPWKKEKAKRAQAALLVADGKIAVAAKWLDVSRNTFKKLLEEAREDGIEDRAIPDYFYDFLDRPILDKIFKSILQESGDLKKSAQKLFVTPQSLKAVLEKLKIPYSEDSLSLNEDTLFQIFSYLMLAQWTQRYGTKKIRTGPLSDIRKEYLIRLAIQSERDLNKAVKISGVSEPGLLAWIKEAGLSETLFKPYGKMVKGTEQIEELPLWKDYLNYASAQALLENKFDLDKTANLLEMDPDELKNIVSFSHGKEPQVLDSASDDRNSAYYDQLASEKLNGFSGMDLEGKIDEFRKVFASIFEFMKRQPGDIELQRLTLSGLRMLAPEVLPVKRGKKQVPTPAQMEAALTLLRTQEKASGKNGYVGELMTGEGKTLAIGMAAAVEALKGSSVYVMTPNDYLASHGVKELIPLYQALGLKVAVIDSNLNQQYLFYVDGNRIRRKKISRKEAYEANIVYGASSTFVYDHLFDKTRDSDSKIQNRKDVLLIDEVDNVLIDEATNPLVAVVPGKSEIPPAAFRPLYEFAKTLSKDDFVLDVSAKKVNLTSSGIDKTADYAFHFKSHFPPGQYPRLFEDLSYLVTQMLCAEFFYKRDVDYVVAQGRVWVVDEYTGRIQPNRRFGFHIHEAISAKENLTPPETLVEFSSITYPRYVKLFKHVAGLTGTVYESAREFLSRYGLELRKIQPAQPLVREDLPDVIFKTQKEKWDAVVEKIRHVSQIEKRPIVVGVRSIEQSFMLSRLLKEADINHNLLNGLQGDAEEHDLVGQAGTLDKNGNGQVTVVTNVAGRGTDIIVEDRALENGGIFILGTERHAAARVDWQLRGRGGRQGEKASSQFFVSLEDDLIKSVSVLDMRKILAAVHVDEKSKGAIEDAELSLWVNERQEKAEDENRSIRDHHLSLDTPLEKLSDLFDQFKLEMGHVTGRWSEDAFRRELAELWHRWNTSQKMGEEPAFNPVSVENADLQTLLDDEILYSESRLDGAFMHKFLDVLSARWTRLWRDMRSVEEQLLQSDLDPSERREKFQKALSDYWKGFLSGIFRDTQYLSDQGFPEIRKQKIEEGLIPLIRESKGNRQRLKEILETYLPKIPRASIYAFIKENPRLRRMISLEKEHSHLSEPLLWLKEIFEGFAASHELPENFRGGEITVSEFQDRWVLNYAFELAAQKKSHRLVRIDFERKKGGYLFIKDIQLEEWVKSDPWLSASILTALFFPLKNGAGFRRTGTVLNWNDFERVFLPILEKTRIADADEIAVIKRDHPAQVVLYARAEKNEELKAFLSGKVNNKEAGETDTWFQIDPYFEGRPRQAFSPDTKDDDEDGFIQQGRRSSKVFNRQKKRMEENDITDRFAQFKRDFISRLDTLIQRQDLPHIQKAKLLRQLPELKEKIETMKILGFKGIVKNENDFFLGHMDLKNGIFFLAEDLMDTLTRQDRDLALEYFSHEILCPILGHYPAIYIQQYMFEHHYPDLEKKMSQAALKTPYKGLLGKALRFFIQDKIKKRRQRKEIADAKAETSNIENITVKILEKIQDHAPDDIQGLIGKMEEIFRGEYPYLLKSKHDFARRQIIYKVLEKWGQSKENPLLSDTLVQSFETILQEKGISRDVINVLLSLAGTRIFYKTLIQLGLEFDKDEKVVSLLLNFYVRAYVRRYVTAEERGYFERRLTDGERSEFERVFGRKSNCEEWIVQYAIGKFFGKDTDFFRNKSNNIEELFFGSGIEDILFSEIDLSERASHLYSLGQRLVQAAPVQEVVETELQKEIVRRLSLPILSLFQDDSHLVDASA